MSLNGVTCQQWKTGYDWPASYWDCVSPSSPTSLDQVPAALATSLVSVLKSQLATNPTYLYVFTNTAQARTFQSLSTSECPDDASGCTAVYVNDQNIYVRVAEQPEGSTVTSMQLNEITAHELGHATDFTYGLDVQSGSSTYNEFATNDFLHLDYSTVGTSKATSVSYSQK